MQVKLADWSELALAFMAWLVLAGVVLPIFLARGFGRLLKPNRRN